ncbi:MAG TPA: CARDB domain-containing protein, partial [Vicinamibacteria bacterium]
VAESNEGNNTAFDSISIVRADLDVRAVSGPASTSPGGSFNVSNTVRNIGTAAAGAFRVGIYLSPDNVCTTTDTLLASRNLASLGVGLSSTANTPVVIPGSTALGTRHLCVIVDDQSVVAESSEANNTRSTPINVLSAIPVVNLKVNGIDGAAVNTTGPYQLTLDIAPTTYTASLDWYWAIVVNGSLQWVTSGGLSTVPAPLLSAPPAPVTNLTLLNTNFPVGTSITNVFLLLNGGTTVSSDLVSTTVVP